jgi:cytochrome c oxidase subunit IV
MADQVIKHEDDAVPPSSVKAPPIDDGGAEPAKAHAVAGGEAVAHASGHAHGHAGHAHGGHGHGLAHTTPVSLLIGILAALMLLTLITVAVTAVDLGAQGNLIVAMLIATIKAGLVVMFFMHLVWDKKLHLILFLVSVLFLILFLSGSITDRQEYQPSIDQFQTGAQQ